MTIPPTRPAVEAMVAALMCFHRGEYGQPEDPINPDGPEAAAMLSSLLAEIEALRHDIERANGHANEYLNELEAARALQERLIGQYRVDLASTHAEICKLQGLDPAP